MNNLIQKLNDTTLGDAFHAVKDVSLKETLLSFTGILTIVELLSALFAELRNDREEAGWSLGVAYVSLLVNALVTVMSGEREED